MFRRREARCCLLVAFVVVVLISTFALSTDYLDPHLSDLSLPKVNIPQWLKPGKQDVNYYPDTATDTPSAPEASSNAAATAAPQPEGGGGSGSGSNLGLKQTRLAQKPHVPGYTVLDNLYLRNGTFFVLTSEEAEFPSTTDIMGRRPLVQDEKRGTSGAAATVIDQDLRFLDLETALLGRRVTRIPGVSVVVLDPPSKAPNTFYSWWTEVVLGAWRVSTNASALLDRLEDDTEISASLLSRFILPDADPGSWDSSINLNGPIMRGGLPNTAVETRDYWQDLRALDSTIIFDRVVLISREAAMARRNDAVDVPADSTSSKATVTAAVGNSRSGSLDLPEVSWDPARKAIVRNLLGYLPDAPAIAQPQISQSTHDLKPVVALFSATATQRKQGSHLSTMGVSNYVLATDTHRSLVDALHSLEDEGICEVHVLDAEHVGVRAQIELAARSTILLGAHGEALTNQLWMPRSPLSTVIDLMRPQVFLPEYEVLARTLGHQYWAVWNDTLVKGNEAFERTRETNIEDCDKVPLHVDAQVVVQFIKAHLGIQMEDRQDATTTAAAEDSNGHADAAKSLADVTSILPPDLEVDILG